jgi:hypothetical protein
MKRVLAAFLALATVGAAAPALAADDRRWNDRRWEDRWDRGHERYDRRDHRWDERAGYRGSRADRLDWRIDQGVRSGRLTRREAARLYAELNWIAAAERRAARDGLSWYERRELDRRYDRLAWEVRRQKRDDDRRYGYYGYRR